MGVLRAQLVVQSSDILSSVLNIGYNSSVEADSGVLMKAKVLKTSAHADALTIYKADDKTTQAYVFVRNMNSEREKYIYVYNDTDSDAAVAKLGGGEFAFRVGLPGKSGVGGGIAAILPEHYCITVWSPRLNENGNSLMGMKALELFTTKTGTSIF